MDTGVIIGLLGLLIGASSLGLFWWKSREQLEATLRPRMPNFGLDHVDIWFWLVNEGKRAIEILSAEARFEYEDADGRVFSTESTGFRFGGLVEPGTTADMKARIPFIEIGEEWRKLRQNVPSGEMRLRLRFGKKVEYTPWERTKTGDERDRTS